MLKQINRTTEELLGFNYKITIKKLTKLWQILKIKKTNR
jgi:hypothetical protein